MEVVHLKAIIVLAVEDSTGGLGFFGLRLESRVKVFDPKDCSTIPDGGSHFHGHFVYVTCYMLSGLGTRNRPKV